MFDGSDPCWIPRIPIEQPTRQRLRIAQFGDGYQQRTLDGINALELSWNLTWEMKPKDDLLAMDAYLADREGHAFPFQHPVTLITYIVFCDEWNLTWLVRRPNEAGAEWFGNLSAQFVKANGIAITAEGAP